MNIGNVFRPAVIKFLFGIFSISAVGVSMIFRSTTKSIDRFTVSIREITTQVQNFNFPIQASELGLRGLEKNLQSERLRPLLNNQIVQANGTIEENNETGAQPFVIDLNITNFDKLDTFWFNYGGTQFNIKESWYQDKDRPLTIKGQHVVGRPFEIIDNRVVINAQIVDRSGRTMLFIQNNELYFNELAVDSVGNLKFVARTEPNRGLEILDEWGAVMYSIQIQPALNIIVFQGYTINTTHNNLFVIGVDKAKVLQLNPTPDQLLAAMNETNVQKMFLTGPEYRKMIKAF